jgi:hypothetical protein
VPFSGEPLPLLGGRGRGRPFGPRTTDVPGRLLKLARRPGRSKLDVGRGLVGDVPLPATLVRRDGISNEDVGIMDDEVESRLRVGTCFEFTFTLALGGAGLTAEVLRLILRLPALGSSGGGEGFEEAAASASNF